MWIKFCLKDYSLSYFSGSTFSDLPIQVENNTNRHLVNRGENYCNYRIKIAQHRVTA